jgi:hypothetical protein
MATIHSSYKRSFCQPYGFSDKFTAERGPIIIIFTHEKTSRNSISHNSVPEYQTYRFTSSSLRRWWGQSTD